MHSTCVPTRLISGSSYPTWWNLRLAFNTIPSPRSLEFLERDQSFFLTIQSNMGDFTCPALLALNRNWLFGPYVDYLCACLTNSESEYDRLRPNYPAWGGIFDLDAKTERIEYLSNVASDADFWNDNEKAQTILKERSRLESVVETFQSLTCEVHDLMDLVDLAQEENDPSPLYVFIL